MEKTIREGRAWVLLDEDNRLIENIDTDQIYHNAFLHITNTQKMGQYAFGNLKGWEDFPKKSRPGDIILAGRNFGAGSSRQQAVDCFIALGIGLIMAPSFGAIYFRNAVNSGFPVIKCPGLEELVKKKTIVNEDMIRVDLRTGEGRNLFKNIAFAFEPMSGVQYEIFQSGTLFQYGKKLNHG